MNLNDTLHLISTIIQTDTALCRTQASGFYYSRLAPVRDGDGPQWRTIEDMWLVTNRHVIVPKKEDVGFPSVRLTFCLRKLKLVGKSFRVGPRYPLGRRDRNFC